MKPTQGREVSLTTCREEDISSYLKWAAQCKYVCQACPVKGRLTTDSRALFYRHIYKEHDDLGGAKKYKAVWGADPAIYKKHACRLCNKEMFLDRDVLQGHMKVNYTGICLTNSPPNFAINSG